MSDHLLKKNKELAPNHYLFSNDNPEYGDDVIECMQFGICSYQPKPVNKIPYYYHF